MFIVTPYLTKEPTTYGIYAVCMSVTIFLNYADLGFLRAGQKYAAECFARNDRVGEMKYIGFGAFVLFVFTLMCTSVFFYLGFNPNIMIKGLDTFEKISTATSLLLILSSFAPVTVLQRIVAMIFDIRLESYISQRISLFASVITIFSVFYFFRNDHYQIVHYFLFSQSVNLVGIIICIFLAKHKYAYNMLQLFRFIHFDQEIFTKSKSLAFSGLYIMIIWILFYELDQIVIGKFLGAEKVAVYAIAFAFASFFRSIYGILFSPFTVRANHYVGSGDEEGLKRFSIQLFTISAPLVIIPTLAFALIAKPFILSWVGPNFTESIPLAVLFSLIFTCSFISYTTNTILIAKVRIKEMYIVSTIQPFVYWIGILFTYSFLGLISFGSFKFIATLISEAFYFYILFRFIGISVRDLLHRSFYPIILPLLFMVPVLLFASEYLPHEKSRINLLIIVLTTGVTILISFFIQYLTSSNIRIVAKSMYSTIVNQKS
jgi:O-antigen/teichoic acid export membrane protein